MGVSLRNLLLQMAVALKRQFSNPTLAKPKCVSEAGDFFNFLKFVNIFSCLFTIDHIMPPLKHILALLTLVQKCTVSVL